MSRKLALIIGNSHYQDINLAKLVAPTEDVNDLADILRDGSIGGFDQVNTLIDESDATIRLNIEDFFADKKPDDLLVLYFSGHGVRDEQGRLYLAAPNTRSNRLRATAIATDFITTEMDRSRSKRQVLILDCCHSGAFAQGSKAVTGESAGIGPAFEGNGYGRVVLTATDATQYAWEGDKIIGEADNSLFTHFMVEGLRTGAADLDADGRITLDEMYDYVYEQVVMQTPKQTPGKWSYRQQGDIVIARNPKPIVKPAALPADLKTALESPLSNVRLGAVRELDRLLNGSNAGLALAAFEAIKSLAEDDSRSVSTAASSALQAYAEKQRVREEQERLAKERAEAERQAALKAEQDRLAAAKAERERIIKERAEAERAEAERQAALKAEQERIAKEKAEAERQAAVKAEQDRLAAEQAEKERIARERAEAERQAALKAEQERVAQERFAKERAEAERQAALKAEADRQAALKAEQERVAQERIAKEQAEAERQAALKAEADRQAALKAEQERVAKERAEAERLSASEEIFDTARRAAVVALQLVIQSGPDAGQTFALRPGVNIIGRMNGIAIRLTDGLISRQHVRLSVEADRVTVQDLDSANGTFLNTRRLSGAAPVTLHDGDTLALGDTVLVFHSPAPAKETRAPESYVAPPIESETIIAAAPQTFAQQMIAAQPTRLSEVVQSPIASVGPLQTIGIPALITAAGFGVILTAWVNMVQGASDFFSGIVLSVIAVFLLGLVLGVALRSIGLGLAPRRLFGLAGGWVVAGGLGAGAAFVLARVLEYGSHSPDFATTLLILLACGLVCGLVGGQITSRVVRALVPRLNSPATNWGWIIAWAGGLSLWAALVWDNGDFDAVKQALALCGALIGAMGGGVMFWQIAQSRKTALIDAIASDLTPRATPVGTAISSINLPSSAMRSIGIISSGWVLINLFDVLVGQMASFVLDTPAYFSVGYGAGCLVLALVLQRVLPAMKRTAWLLAGGWALAMIGAVQIGVATQFDSNWLNVVGNGICGVIGAWAVLHTIPSVPRWQYGVIGLVWLLADAIGSGYAWEMVIHKLYNGWTLTAAMSELNVSVLALVLGPVLSAVVGGVLMGQFILRAQRKSST